MKPKYIAIAAMTLDGKIAKGPKHFSDWTSKEDKKFMRALLDKCDCVIVGSNTYKTAIKPLSKRNCIVFTRTLPSSPGEGRIQKRSSRGIYRQSKNLLYCNPAKAKVGLLTKKLDCKKVAILGGAQTYAYCLEHNLLDEIYLTLEPLVFGIGLNLFEAGVSSERKFKLLSFKRLNSLGSLLLHYKKS